MGDAMPGKKGRKNGMARWWLAMREHIPSKRSASFTLGGRGGRGGRRKTKERREAEGDGEGAKNSGG